jgi:hypothetical protein
MESIWVKEKNIVSYELETHSHPEVNQNVATRQKFEVNEKLIRSDHSMAKKSEHFCGMN